MTSKERANLRAKANSLESLFQVGKGGISDALIKQTDDALEARELIKARVLPNSDYTPKIAAEEIAGATGADVVGVIGTKFILYKESKENKKIEL